MMHNIDELMVMRQILTKMNGENEEIYEEILDRYVWGLKRMGGKGKRQEINNGEERNRIYR